MTKYKVSYMDLRTDEDSKAALAQNLTYNHVAGLQRGLIVLQRLSDDQIQDAYSTIAYFHENRTRPSEIQFLRETDVVWNLDDVMTRLKRSRSKIEVLADVDLETLTVKLNTQTNPKDLEVKSREAGYEKPQAEYLPNKDDLRALGFDMDTPLQTEPKPIPRPGETIQLERYLARFGAFKRSQSKRTKIIKKNGN